MRKSKFEIEIVFFIYSGKKTFIPIAEWIVRLCTKSNPTFGQPDSHGHLLTSWLTVLIKELTPCYAGLDDNLGKRSRSHSCLWITHHVPEGHPNTILPRENNASRVIVTQHIDRGKRKR